MKGVHWILNVLSFPDMCKKNRTWYYYAEFRRSTIYNILFVFSIHAEKDSHDSYTGPFGGQSFHDFTIYPTDIIQMNSSIVNARID